MWVQAWHPAGRKGRNFGGKQKVSELWLGPNIGLL
jgi:hypothetical protein